MARRRRRNVSKPRRDLQIKQVTLPRRPLVATPPRSGRLFEIEDRRTYHPGPRPVGRGFRVTVPRVVARPARFTQRTGQRPVAKQFERGVPRALSFRLPSNLVLCVRRRRRRNALFAFGYSGRNGGRRYRRNANSSISCRR